MGLGHLWWLYSNETIVTRTQYLCNKFILVVERSSLTPSCRWVLDSAPIGAKTSKRETVPLVGMIVERADLTSDDAKPLLHSLASDLQDLLLIVLLIHNRMAM